VIETHVAATPSHLSAEAVSVRRAGAAAGSFDGCGGMRATVLEKGRAKMARHASEDQRASVPCSPKCIHFSSEAGWARVAGLSRQG
jgi:hypothetical protein